MKNVSENNEIVHSQSLEYKRWRADVAEAFYEADLDSVADKFLSCCDRPRRMVKTSSPVLPDGAESVFVCSGSKDHDAAFFLPTCDLRVCPDCARRAAARLVARYTPVIEKLIDENKRFRLRKIVLTTAIDLGAPNVAEMYSQGFASVVELFNRLLPTDWRKKQGFIVCAEFGETGMKLHFHILYFGQYIMQSTLSRVWREVSPDGSYITFIREALQDYPDAKTAIRETLKYSVKFWKTHKDGTVQYIPAELMVKLHTLLAGTRRVRSYGVLYDIPEEEASDYCCEECGSKMIRINISFWEIFRNTGLMPWEYERQMQQAELHLKHANKSPPKSVPEERERIKTAVSQLTFTDIGENGFKPPKIYD